MKLIILFGLPGAGKSFVGKLLEKKFGFFVYEADTAMPQELQQAIREQRVTSDTLRDSFFENIIAHVKKLQANHTKLAITQVFIKEKYRKQFLEAFPDSKFILIDASNGVREERLMKQKTWQLNLTYWKKMAEIFERPQVPHIVIYNNDEGEEQILKQLSVILASETRPESL